MERCVPSHQTCWFPCKTDYYSNTSSHGASGGLARDCRQCQQSGLRLECDEEVLPITSSYNGDTRKEKRRSGDSSWRGTVTQLLCVLNLSHLSKTGSVILFLESYHRNDNINIDYDTKQNNPRCSYCSQSTLFRLQENTLSLFNMKNGWEHFSQSNNYQVRPSNPQCIKTMC